MRETASHGSMGGENAPKRYVGFDPGMRGNPTTHPCIYTFNVEMFESGNKTPDFSCMLISVLSRVYGAKRGAELVFVACFKKPVGFSIPKIGH